MIDEIIRQSLEEFVFDVRSIGWYGREREAISLYVLGHLINYCKKSSELYDPAQICIEGAVPQITNSGKKQVCKDLVIWKKPKMTCWDTVFNAVESPMAIIEWKVKTDNNKKVKNLSNNDIEWLEKFTQKYGETIGFSILLSIGGAFTIKLIKVRNGTSKEVQVG